MGFWSFSIPLPWFVIHLQICHLCACPIVMPKQKNNASVHPANPSSTSASLSGCTRRERHPGRDNQNALVIVEKEGLYFFTLGHVSPLVLL